MAKIIILGITIGPIVITTGTIRPPTIHVNGGGEGGVGAESALGDSMRCRENARGEQELAYHRVSIITIGG